MEAEIDALFGVEDGAANGGGVQKALARLDMEGDSPDVIYLLSDYVPPRLTLAASDGFSTWAGSLSNQELAGMATCAKLEKEEFISTTLKALTRKEMSSLDFTYTAAVVKNGNLKLSWKKHLVSLNIKFLLGTVTLCPQSSAAADHTSLLEYAISSITDLQNANSNLLGKCDRLVAERQRALERLEKCADLKEEIESDLYGKFKVVLNDKKTKIHQLIEQNAKLVTQLEEARSKPAATNSKSQSASSAVPTPLSHGGESDTDDEMETTRDHSATPPPRPKPASAKPTSSCGLTTSILGDPLKTISPPTKRRRREAPKKATGQPPDIPLPPPFSSRAQRSRSGSSGRQEKASAHKTSHDSLESNELLDLL